MLAGGPASGVFASCCPTSHAVRVATLSAERRFAAGGLVSIVVSAAFVFTSEFLRMNEVIMRVRACPEA